MMRASLKLHAWSVVIALLGAREAAPANPAPAPTRAQAATLAADLRAHAPQGCDGAVWQALVADVEGDLLSRTEKHFDWAPRFPPKGTPVWACLEPLIRAKGALPAFPKRLRAQRRVVYKWATEIVVFAREGRAADVFLAHVASGDAVVVGPAIYALGELGERRAVAPLSRLLKSKAHRLSACSALEQIGDPAALPSLRTALATATDSTFRFYLEKAIKTLEAKGGA